MEENSSKIIIASYKNGILTCVAEEGRAVLLNFETKKHSQVGNVYVGKVQNIVKNINAAFVDVGEDSPVYYSMGEEPFPVFADRKAHDHLKAGDEIVVKIKKDAVKEKAAVCTCRFHEAGDSKFLNHALFHTAPCLLREAEPFWMHLTRSLTGKKPTDSVTDIPDVREKLSEFTDCRLYCDPQIPLFKVCSLETVVSEALSKKVWLKGGGYLVIEQTEAMTVIDVNTGKTDKKGSKEEIILHTDLEAAEETARQLRLRNLSGMIMVDFIDLKSGENRLQLMDCLNGFLKKDPTETKALDLTALHIAEIVRKRSGKSFSDQYKNIDFD